jgi:hypothetical protein
MRALTQIPNQSDSFGRTSTIIQLTLTLPTRSRGNVVPLLKAWTYGC